MATKEQITKAIEAVQRHIDTVITQFAGHPDLDAIIKAFAARELLRAELATLQGA